MTRTAEPEAAAFTVAHDNLVIERRYEAPVARVYQAWVDVEARTIWGRPDDSVDIVYTEADFRVGGRDVSECRLSGGDIYDAVGHYHDIVAQRRIVFSETVSHGGRCLSAALVTVELAPDGAATRLRFTAQIAAFDGSDMAAGYRQGWEAALDNLVPLLARETRS